MARQLELVQVIKPFRLVDEESYEHVYWRRDGTPLANGYYVVRWPKSGRAGRYDEEAEFRGPYRDRKAAEAGAAGLRLSARPEVHPMRSGRPA